MNNRGFVLPVSILLVLFFSIILSLSFLRSNIELSLASSRTASAKAFFAAETGIEKSIFELRRNSSWRLGFANEELRWQEGNLELLAYYSVSVVDGPLFNNSPTVWLKSTGLDPDNKTPRVIFARVLVDNPARYFISTLKDLRIGSGVTISGDILGRDVIFEINNNLPENERSIMLNDYVYYLRNLVLSDADSGYVTYKGAIQSPPIVFVSVDLNYYRSLAQNGGNYIDANNNGGNFTYSGTIDRTKLNTGNGLIFAEGDIHISGTVNESVLFVAGGNVYIDSDVKCQQAAQIGLFAHQDVKISASAPNSLSVDAFLIADGGLLKADGERGSKDAINFNGAAAIRGIEGARSGVDLNVYNTRNYKHNVELLTNRSIPFIPFITALLNWQEHSLADVFPPGS